METGSETPVLDMRQFLDVTLGDEELMRELVEMLIADTTRLLPSLRDALARRDSGQCMKLAHYGRGACGNLGARAAFTILDELEHCAAARDFSACAALIDRLPAALDRLRAAVIAPTAAA